MGKKPRQIARTEVCSEAERVSAALTAYGACDPRYRRHELISLLAPLYGLLPTPGAKFVPIARRKYVQSSLQGAQGMCDQPFPVATLDGFKPWPPPGIHPRHLPADAQWLRDATWRAMAAYCAMTPGGYAFEAGDVRGEAREAFIAALGALLGDTKPYRGAARIWVHTSDTDNPVLIFMVRSGARVHMLAANFGTAFLAEYIIGLPRCVSMGLLFSTDWREFGGCGYDLSRVRPDCAPSHGFPMSVTLALPPLAALIYRLN